MKSYKFKVTILEPFNCDYAHIYLDNIDENLSKEKIEDLVKDKFIEKFGKVYKKEELSVGWCI